MLQLKQNQTSIPLILTLSELVTINEPYYLFVFTHILTKTQVIFIKSSEDDESDYPTRYNQFTIDPSTVFEDQPIGQWNYTIYQQAGAVNTDPDATDKILEYGKLMLTRAAEFAFTKYNSPTTYSAYNG